MKKSYPTWAVPRTHTIGLDYKVVRARLGAQAVNATRTESELKKRGKDLHAAWMEKTTAAQRSAWAKAAGRASAAKRWGPRAAA